MAFWADGGAMEPKRSYRWVMEFGINGGAEISHYLVKKVDRPSWSLTESKLNFLNHTFYYPGRVEYDEITITVVDAIDPNPAINFQALLANSGYVRPDAAETPDEGGWGTVSKAGWGSGANGAGLGLVQIKQLDANGEEAETWQLYNSWIKSCKPSSLDYESDDMLNVDVTLRFDYFKFDAGPAILDVVEGLAATAGRVSGIFS